jgi:hypothetical protein
MHAPGPPSPLPYVSRVLPCLTVSYPRYRQTALQRPPPWTHDADEYDIKDDATVPPGIIVRTDYSTGSDDAWAAFCSALHDAERDFFADAPNPPPSDDNDVAIPPTTTSNDSDDSDDASTDDESSARALRAPLRPTHSTTSRTSAPYASSLTSPCAPLNSPRRNNTG